MVRFSRGLILMVIGAILYLVGSWFFVLGLPQPQGVILSYLLGPTIFLVGIFFLIKDRGQGK